MVFKKIGHVINRENMRIKIKNDYRKYFESGNKLRFNEDSVLDNDVEVIKEVLINIIDDDFFIQSLKSYYKERDYDENIIEGICEMFEETYNGSFIQGYDEDNHIDHDDILDVIASYFETY